MTSYTLDGMNHLYIRNAEATRFERGLKIPLHPETEAIRREIGRRLHPAVAPNLGQDERKALFLGPRRDRGEDWT